MPEATVTMWVVELTDCPDTDWAVAIGADRFGGIFTSPPLASGLVRLLIADIASRQAVRTFAREVERTVGGFAAVRGKEAVPISALDFESMAEALSQEEVEDEFDEVEPADLWAIN